MEDKTEVEKTCQMSLCHKYRYSLCRQWGDGGNVLFIGLNPSTADHLIDDPTIRRCIDFTKRLGFNCFYMANLFSYRATDPKDMKASSEPIGKDTDAHLWHLCETAEVIIFCWGNHGSYMGRSQEVKEMLEPFKRKIKCFGLNKSGEPKHPLYLAKTTKLVDYYTQEQS